MRRRKIVRGNKVLVDPIRHGRHIVGVFVGDFDTVSTNRKISRTSESFLPARAAHSLPLFLRISLRLFRPNV